MFRFINWSVIEDYLCLIISLCLAIIAILSFRDSLPWLALTSLNTIIIILIYLKMKKLEKKSKFFN